MGPAAAVLIAYALFEVITLRVVICRDAYVAADMVVISPEVNGPMLTLNVSDDQVVVVGAPLFTIDPKPFSIEVDRQTAAVALAEAGLARARDQLTAAAMEARPAEYTNAVRNRDRGVELAKGGDLAPEALDKLQREVQVPSANLDAARAAKLGAQQDIEAQGAGVRGAEVALAKATFDLSRTQVSSPVAGRVAPFQLRPGSYLDAGKPEELKAVGGATQGDSVRTAVVSGFLPCITLLLWARFNLPSVSQIVITSYVVIDRDFFAARVRAGQRLLGCLAGGALGGLAVFVGIDPLAVWSLFFLGGIIGFSRLHLGRGNWTYVGTQGGVAFILVFVTGQGPPDSILPVINRIVGISLGVLIVSAVSVAERCWQSAVPVRPVVG